jgi:hypothetical protein
MMSHFPCLPGIVFDVYVGHHSNRRWALGNGRSIGCIDGGEFLS